MYIVFAFHGALVSPHFSSAMMAMALAGLRAVIRALVIHSHIEQPQADNS